MTVAWAGRTDSRSMPDGVYQVRMQAIALDGASMDGDMHRFATLSVFLVMGRVRSTNELLAMLGT